MYALAIIPGQTSSVLTFADSGVSDHCFVDCEAFAEYKALEIPREGRVASKEAVFQIIGQGTVKKEVTIDGRKTELVFRNALHMPSLTANLISIGKFNCTGFLVVFAQGRVVFKDPEGREILIGRGANGMYLLDSLMDAHTPQAMIATQINQPVDLDGWHCHFGHAGADSI